MLSSSIVVGLFKDCSLDCVAKKCLSLFGRESPASTCTIKKDGVIIIHSAQRSISGLLTPFAVSVSVMLCVNYLSMWNIRKGESCALNHRN